MDDVPLRDAAQAVVDARDLRAKRFQQMGRHPVGVADYHAAAAALESAIEALRAALAAADTAPALVQCGWMQTWDDPTAPPGPLYAMSDDPEDHADEVADERLIPIYRLAAADGTTPTQPDEVLWEGETAGLGLMTPDWGVEWSGVCVPPATRVRVVATPATEQT